MNSLQCVIVSGASIGKRLRCTKENSMIEMWKERGHGSRKQNRAEWGSMGEEIHNVRMKLKEVADK